MNSDYNTTIKIVSAANGDSNEIETLTQLLSARGWCFVEFDEEFNKNLESAFTVASAFFSSSEQQRQRFRHQKNFGYITIPAKHGFHLLTGKRLAEFPIPPTMYNRVRSVASGIDDLSKKLFQVAGSKLFVNNKDYQQEALTKIPLLKEHKYDSVVRTEYGMLDIMQYFVPSTSPNTTTVSEHGDPGLFSFSFKSDQPGLSMLDPISNTWVPVPPNASVMWCGSAAEEISKGLLKVGWHRVEKTFTAPRLTMWYEVCTYEQVPEQFQSKDIVPSKEEVAQLPVESYSLVMVKTLTGKTLEFHSKLHSGNTVNDLQELIEYKEGIPPSKQRLVASGRPLVSDRTLGFYGYESGQIIHLVLALRG